MRRDASTQPGYATEVVATTLDDVLAASSARRQHRAPLLIGVSGLQGSGKSTFARQLANAAAARGVSCGILSLDDFYLGRRTRQQLARDIHPLLATRGVPGTHDVDLLTATITELASASARSPVALPRFDKGRDTRLPPSRWPRVTTPPQLILFEGWCVGLPPQAPDALTQAINALERMEDRDGVWRHWVNAQLGNAYARLWQRLDRLVVLEAPDFAVVTRWRDEQEDALRQRCAPQAMNAAALRRFLMHYERLSRHALRELPARADLRLLLRRDRTVLAVAHTTSRD